MTLVALAFFSGVMIVHGWPQVTLDAPVLWFAVVSGALATQRRVRPVAVLLFALGWAWVNAGVRLAESVDARWEGQDVTVIGTIVSIPVQRERATRFTFHIDELRFNDVLQAAPRYAVLSWFDPAVSPRAGERWRLTLRLKQPHGFANPGGFDYEGWLFANGIRAVGYVRPQPAGERLSAPATLGARITALRQNLVERIHAAVPDAGAAAVLAALVAGDQHALTSEQWDVLSTTGTSHLISISGLHVALVAGLVFGAVRRGAGWFACTRALGPAVLPAAVAALLAAVSYAALAGFAIPTQRSLLMIAVVMTAILLRRHVVTTHGLALSLIVVLCWDPFAPLSVSFWLSFALVAAIFFAASGRRPHHGWWWRFGRLHWLLGLTAVPLVLCFFNQVSWLAPLANAFAVPWVGVVVVPLALIGAAVQPLSSIVGDGLLEFAAWNWRVIEWLLQQMLRIPGSHWFTATPPLWVNLCALVGLFVLMLPRGTPARWLGAFAWLPLLLWRPATPAPGEAWFTLLDVGQGLASVVRTQSHVLVYDTGPRFSETFDTGSAVVLPFLRHHGVAAVDMLVVGHADNDHAGGAASLLRGLPVREFITSVPEQFSMHGAQICAAGRQWEWDGVTFEVLHPSPGAVGRENDLSCVLRVQAGRYRILLTGDIERGAEQQLIARYGPQLAADILVAPHHGSASSSTVEFIDAVAPRWVLFPVGYRNRFGFPVPAVRARYAERGIVAIDSVHDGASEWRLGGAGDIEHFSFRATNRHYWHWVEGQ